MEDVACRNKPASESLISFFVLARVKQVWKKIIAVRWCSDKSDLHIYIYTLPVEIAIGIKNDQQWHTRSLLGCIYIFYIYIYIRENKCHDHVRLWATYLFLNKDHSLFAKLTLRFAWIHDYVINIITHLIVFSDLLCCFMVVLVPNHIVNCSTYSKRILINKTVRNSTLLTFLCNVPLTHRLNSNYVDHHMSDL